MSIVQNVLSATEKKCKNGDKLQMILLKFPESLALQNIYFYSLNVPFNDQTFTLDWTLT